MARERQADVFTDVEVMRDGSARWLWQVRADAMLWRAGVSMSRTDAQREAAEALTLFADRETAEEFLRSGSENLDLDQLEAGDDQDAESVRRAVGEDIGQIRERADRREAE